MDMVFFRRALTAMNCAYIQCIWQIFERYWVNSQFQLQPPMNDPFSIIKEQLQSHILLNLLCFCRARVVATRYYSYYLWYLLGFRNIYIERSLLFYDISRSHPFSLWCIIISWEHLKRSICQGHRIYFTTFIATIHYNKWFVVNSRKFEGYVNLTKAICSPALLKGLICSTELVAVFVWKLLC